MMADEPRMQPSGRQTVAGVIAMLIGSAVLLGGFILYAAERAGRLVIFPFAGRLTMLLGIGGLAIGAALAGRKAALVLSGLVIVGGVALYVVGLVMVEQLGTRVYQAIGLLMALVGLITTYSAYGMDREPAPASTEADPT